jgi:uncharacterized protein (TIGR00369 family)
MVKPIDLAKGQYWETMGLSLLDGNPPKVMLSVKPEVLQAYGKVHGGAIAGLLDSAIAVAVNSEITEDYGAATVELKVNYLKPVSTGKLQSQGKVLSKGRLIMVSEGKVWDEHGNLVAVGIATFRIFKLK